MFFYDRKFCVNCIQRLRRFIFTNFFQRKRHTYLRNKKVKEAKTPQKPTLFLMTENNYQTSHGLSLIGNVLAM